ncbi:hypothetical protein B6D52_01775 [Candidatus Parcubacteria bacterium 4484_255]|nr:MAG: hypothetical protein B6D52_01775 [Candidatus Parcubacteria bacterium 4484_255]
MNARKWENLIFKVEEKFGISKQYIETFEVAEKHDGQKIMGKKEIIEFKGPLGLMKLEKISQPRVIDQKVLSSRRVGGKVAVDFVYSDTEEVFRFNIYKKEQGGEWKEVRPETMGIE